MLQVHLTISFEDCILRLSKQYFIMIISQVGGNLHNLDADRITL